MDNQKGEVTVKDKVAYFASIWWLRIVVPLGVIIVIIYCIYLCNPKHNSFFSIFLISFSLVGFPLVVISFVEYLRKDGNLLTLGFQFNRFGVQDILRGLLLAFLAVCLIFIVATFAGANIFLSYFDSELIIPSISFAIIKAIYFCGIFFRGVEHRFGKAIGLILSSLFFASAHLQNVGMNCPSFINILLLGIALCTMFALTRSFWMPIAFQGVWASVVIITNTVMYADNKTYVPFVFKNIPENIRWLFAGEYGFEQGLFTTLVLLLILLALPKITKVSPYVAAALFKQQYAESEARGIKFKHKLDS